MSVQFGNVDDIRTDPKLELEGVDLDLGKGRFITIRRAGGANRAYNAALMKALRKQGRSGLADPTPEVIEDATRRALIDTVVLGWRGFLDVEGNEVPFTKANLAALFDQVPDILDKVREMSASASLFRQDDLENDAAILGK